MCIIGVNPVSTMETDEDDKFEAQVAKYNVHFKALMALVPITQHEEELDSDEEVNGYGDSGRKGKDKKQKKGKQSNPPGGTYGSKASKKQKNQYKHGMSLADALKTKRQARKQSKAKAKIEKMKAKQEAFKGKKDKFKGKHRPGGKKS